MEMVFFFSRRYDMEHKDINTKYTECSANIRKISVFLLCDIDAISRFIPGEQQFTGHVTEPYIDVSI